jgi:hypothetical protein
MGALARASEQGRAGAPVPPQFLPLFGGESPWIASRLGISVVLRHAHIIIQPPLCRSVAPRLFGGSCRYMLRRHAHGGRND